MRYQIATLAVALTLCATTVARADGRNEKDEGHRQGESSVQLGPRPFFLVNEMEDGRLKRQLQKCTAGPFKKSDFSIGHRGAALQFPSTRASPTRQVPEWVRASSSVMSRLPRTSSSSAGTRRTICTRPPTSWSRRSRAVASSRSRRPSSGRTVRSSRRQAPSAGPASSRSPSSRRGARHHHLDTRAIRHPGRWQQWFLLPDHRRGDKAGWRSLQGARCASEGRGHPWGVFRLGRTGHLLRQLHGFEIEPENNLDQSAQPAGTLFEHSAEG
jgi:hypothetical protein